ncbi:hypothetical protein BMASAVP1_A3330 [Burkholderia mallei SAVP1]|nr:hypothetical protein BMASAVP1_A3330 [Burkholderia mallei SAVP1]
MRGICRLPVRAAHRALAPRSIAAREPFINRRIALANCAVPPARA